MIKDEFVYLGIKDKNEKELTSKSVIEFSGHKGKIFYSEKTCSFKIKWEDGYVRPIDKEFIKNVNIL